jgi:hypothetical protein
MRGSGATPRGAARCRQETYAATACGVRSLWLGHISDVLSLESSEWASWARPAAMTEVSVSLVAALVETLRSVSCASRP